MRAIGAVLICLSLMTRSLHAEEPTGLREDMVLSEDDPWSSNAELARRGLTPLSQDALAADLEKRHKKLAAHPLVAEQERFVLYVPPEMPPGGYGLLVFVGPWQAAKVPPGWQRILDLFGVIYVSAARSGNEEIVQARREPLALMAAGAVEKLYPVNPAHIFVGGLSGGSRVAEKLAIGYPDLFKGALLNAGSDRLGESGVVVPPKDLFRQFQENSRIVFVTGEQDGVNLELDRDTQLSFEEFCVQGGTSQNVPLLGHAVAPASALKQALRWLLDARPLDESRLDSCRAKLDGKIAAALGKVKELKAKGDGAAARSALEELDTRYGGLAAPESVELARSP